MRRTMTNSRIATKKATRGAEAIGTSTFCRVDPSWTAPHPAEAIPAPMSPPTRTWVSEMGRPRRYVTKSKANPPTTTATTKGTSTMPAGTIPCPKVLATASPKRTPTMFPPVATATAWRGRNTREPTTVEIAFAASVKPLQKVQNRRRPKAR